MISFYLVMMAGNYIGPLPQLPCQNAAMLLSPYGVVCKQADYAQICIVPDHPNSYQSCPHFTFPQVTIK